MYTQSHTPTVVQGAGDDGAPLGFWHVAIFRNDFAFSGKPLILSTRWGILYGWWRWWRSVTVTVVATLAATFFLSRIRNYAKLNSEKTQIITLQYFIHKLYFYPRKKVEKTCIFTKKWLDHLRRNEGTKSFYGAYARGNLLDSLSIWLSLKKKKNPKWISTGYLFYRSIIYRKITGFRQCSRTKNSFANR